MAPIRPYTQVKRRRLEGKLEDLGRTRAETLLAETLAPGADFGALAAGAAGELVAFVGIVAAQKRVVAKAVAAVTIDTQTGAPIETVVTAGDGLLTVVSIQPNLFTATAGDGLITIGDA